MPYVMAAPQLKALSFLSDRPFLMNNISGVLERISTNLAQQQLGLKLSFVKVTVSSQNIFMALNSRIYMLMIKNINGQHYCVLQKSTFNYRTGGRYGTRLHHFQLPTTTTTTKNNLKPSCRNSPPIRFSNQTSPRMRLAFCIPLLLLQSF